MHIGNYYKIRCPHCGYEYLLSEIFDTEDVLGTPSNIMRDDDGKIIFVEGEQPITKQVWCCDKCGSKFQVSVDLSTWESALYPSKDEEEDFVLNLEDTGKKKLF